MGLYEKLIAYSKENIIPMHMPGHKRDPQFSMVNPYSVDITEIEGMDDLHNPTGVILELMEECRDFYGSLNTYLLVNGSTSGNLIAIASCCGRGDVILVDEVCHRSVPHAVDILGLRQITLSRGISNDIPAAIEPNEVEKALQRADKTGELPAAVIITSPTYEGVVSDVAKIAEIAHRYDVPLIVDEAHGAHLTLARKACLATEKSSEILRLSWPAPAIQMGADLVIESLHKTLPSLTQTALLHRLSERISDEKIMYYHDVFVTSSPSYVLMSSIDLCMQWQLTEGVREFIEYDNELFKLYSDLGEVCAADKDPSKIILRADGKYKSGEELAGALREKKIEPELVKSTYVVLMTSPVDKRRLPDLNRRIRELQSHALPLG